MRRRFITIGVAQMRESRDIGKNIREITDLSEEARRSGAEIVCFPECALTGYGPWYHQSSANFDPDMVGAAISDVRAIARETGLA